jgi:hypothetical protein
MHFHPLRQALSTLRLLHLAVVGISFLPLQLRAQPICDSGLTAADGPSGYTMREDDRCEGIHTSVIHGEGLSLISFTVGGFTYNLSENTVIDVKPPAGPGVAYPLQIRSVARPLRTYYRMDARLYDGGVLRWPVRTVLLPCALPSTRVGVFGFFGSGAQRVYVPVRTRTSASWTSGAARIIVRTADNLDSLRWRIYPVTAPTPPGWTRLSGTMAAGAAKIVTLPTGEAARMRFEFAGKLRDSDEWQTLRITVLRPGS